MQKSETIGNLAAALTKFQMEVSNPKNTSKNPQFNSKYAPLDTVINTVKPILGKFGLAFIQSTGSEEDKIIIKTMLIHESGEWLESDPLILPAYQLKRGGEKEFNAQGAGSAITYGRRYSLSAILGISSEDDDDANGVVFPQNQPVVTQPASSFTNSKKLPKLIGEIKTEWSKKGLQLNQLDAQATKLYGKKLTSLTEEQAQDFIDLLTGKKEAV